MFDTVHHHTFVMTLGKLGYGKELIDWVTAFLADRTSRLIVDGVEVGPFHRPYKPRVALALATT